MIRWHECKRHPVATVVVVVSLLTVLGLVVLLAANPVDPPPRVPAWLPEVLVPTSANAWPGALLIVALGVHFAAVTRVRSGRSIALESAILWSVLITVVLGAISYLRCLQGESWLSVVVWVTSLFSSEVETAVIGPGVDEGVCKGPYPLTFQVARLFGSAALVLGASAVLLRLLRPGADRFRVWWAGDLDVVVGLSPATLPLIAALVDDDRRRHDAPRWYRRTLGDAWRWLGRFVRRARRTRVVVLHANPADPLVAEARTLGAIVYLDDPTSKHALRRVVRPWWRVKIRRFFAVTDAQGVNTAIVTAVRDIIEEQAADGLSGAVVPRLVARFADPREARDWRLMQLSARSCFVDAINVEAILARELVDWVVGAGVRHVLIVGDHPLAVALLDEIAQQRAFHHELDQAGGAQPQEAGFPVALVTLLGARATKAREEWHSHRTPASDIPVPLQVDTVEDPWEDEVTRRCCQTTDPVALVITGPPSDEVGHQALRVHRAHPHLIVLRPSRHVHGIDASAGGGQSVVRYGPSLTEAGGVPEDTWTALARQQHQVYVREQPWRVPGVGPTAARRPWPRGPLDGGDLPEFLREDNLRQQRQLLQELAARGYAWREVTVGALRRPPANDDLIAAARREHVRWCDLRLASGWRYTRPWSAGVRTPLLRLWQRVLPVRPPVPSKVPTDDKDAAKAVTRLLDEQWRTNPNLLDWSTGEPLRWPSSGREAGGPLEALTESAQDMQEWDIWTLSILLRRLYRCGIAPVPAPGARSVTGPAPLTGAAPVTAAGIDGPQRYRRRGGVEAVQRNEDWEWTTSDGSVLRSKAGDWWVVDQHGGRGVAAVEFARTYKAKDEHASPTEPASYRRVGDVRAERILAPTVVRTPEGPVAAERGMWLVSRVSEDEAGRPVTIRWPVADDVFFDGYLPALSERWA